MTRRRAILGAVSRRVKDSAPVLALRKRLYDRRFAATHEWRNLARGIFDGFDAARKSAPASMPVGYVLDDEAYAQNTSIEPHDYPALFWLRSELERGTTLLDFGGHVGLQYFAYARYVAYASSTRWIVSEQAHVAALGRELAKDREAPHLSFVEDMTGLAPDIFFSAGCLQSVEESLPSILGRLARRPVHVFLNKLPLYDRETRVTLQNTGRSYTPCRLYNTRELVASIETLGYQLVDRWRCLDRSIHIPFHSQYDVPTYSGLYFTLRQ